MSEPANVGKIYAALASVIAEVGAVGKNKRNEQQQYNYRSCDDVCDAVRPLLGKAGVCVTKRIVEKTQEDFTTRNGVLMIWVKIKCEWTFYASDGSLVKTEACGEGMDMGDKAINKAETGSLKNALLQMFMVMGHEDSETPGPQDDGGPVGRQERMPRERAEPHGRQEDRRQSRGGQQQGRRQNEPMPERCPKCGHTGAIHQKRGGGYQCWKSQGGCEHEWTTAAQVAASTPGVTTGDNIPPPTKSVFDLAIDTINNAVQLRDLQMLRGTEARIIERVEDGSITEQQFMTLGGKIAEAEQAIKATAD